MDATNMMKFSSVLTVLTQIHTKTQNIAIGVGNYTK
jgi:hypothetical protein